MTCGSLCSQRWQRSIPSSHAHVAPTLPQWHKDPSTMAPGFLHILVLDPECRMLIFRWPVGPQRLDGQCLMLPVGFCVDGRTTSRRPQEDHLTHHSGFYITGSRIGCPLHGPKEHQDPYVELLPAGCVEVPQLHAKNMSLDFRVPQNRTALRGEMVTLCPETETPPPETQPQLLHLPNLGQTVGGVNSA